MRSFFQGKQLPRRIIQYLLGLVCMAIGLVLLKRTVWGVSPITAVPDAVANITPLSLGAATTFLHLICVVMQVILQKKLTVKSILTAFVGIPFGYLIDIFMWLWNPTLVIWQKIIALLLGVAIQGLGVALINGCDMMLPAPDALNEVIGKTFHKKLSNVKMCADGVYVLIAVVINLLSTHSLASVGISTVVAVLLTGRFVGWFRALFPKMKMTPFFPS